jgi:hypothetical protein
MAQKQQLKAGPYLHDLEIYKKAVMLGRSFPRVYRIL